MTVRAPLTVLASAVLGTSLASFVFVAAEFVLPYVEPRQSIFATALTLTCSVLGAGLSSASLNMRFEDGRLARRYAFTSVPFALLALFITGILFL